MQLSNHKRVLGRNVAKLRMRCKPMMTQEKLADAIGVSYSMVSQIESGSATPSVGTLLRIIDVTNAKPEEILHSLYHVNSGEDELTLKIKHELMDMNDRERLFVYEMIQSYKKSLNFMSNEKAHYKL